MLENLVTFEIIGTSQKGAIKYSNGYLETWNEFQDNSSFFIIPFKDDNYSFLVSINEYLETTAGFDGGIKPKTKNKEYIFIDNKAGGTPKHKAVVRCFGYWK